MRTLRDFMCTGCGCVTEKLLHTDITQILCPECGLDAVQLMSMPTVRLEGISGDFPDAHSRWAKIREDNARIKAERSR